MAQKVNISLVDDIDESEASETVSFGLDGTTYEIDLNDGHASELRDALSEYIAHARKVGGRNGRPGRASRSSTARSAGSDGPSAKVVREWARENGHEVPDRGRVPAEIRDAYLSAH